MICAKNLHFELSIEPAAKTLSLLPAVAHICSNPSFAVISYPSTAFITAKAVGQNLEVTVRNAGEHTIRVAGKCGTDRYEFDVEINVTPDGTDLTTQASITDLTV